MRSSLFTLFAVAALAGCQSSPESGPSATQSTGQPAAAASPSNAPRAVTATSPQPGAASTTAQPAAQAGSPSAGGTATAQAGSSPAVASPGGQVADRQLQMYVDARRQLESQYPELKAALQSGGDLSDQRDRLRPALSASRLMVDDFIQIHQQVQQDPTLRSRVEAALGTPGTTGAAGATSGGSATSGGAATQPGWRGGSDASPPTTSGGAAGTDAAPSASPK
jgi:hypothetical protein